MMEHEARKPPLEYAFAVLGGASVGKSALTIRLVMDKWDPTPYNPLHEYDANIEDTYYKEIMVDGLTGSLDILDIAGQGELLDKLVQNHRATFKPFTIDGLVCKAVHVSCVCVCVCV